MGKTWKNEEQQKRKGSHMQKKAHWDPGDKLKTVAREDIRESFEKKVKVNCVK